ncbi:MAG TPA: symmetrical bis(5'-nucleosyl)-tetraphosphatase [Gammaproteobacteria bacterium]|nr:symmetrical bis(5'-nucleosyl)-tetraphosphatase [Gammaproteobacteria bacterium]
MAVYAIGDIQGCGESLRRLLERIRFEPTRDQLWLTGDLVNRGPDSLWVLRYVRDLGERAITVLGNHDLHMLAVWAGHTSPRGSDTIAEALEAPDADELMHWLRVQPLLHHDPSLGYLMTHAGIPPAWDLATAKRCATELETVLRQPDFADFLREIYGNQPDTWDETLSGVERLRYITNAFTRMRVCDGDGRLQLHYKGEPGTCPPEHMPWFEVPNRRYDGPTIVCGHWSALGYHDGNGILALDTGCVWGGQLTAVRLDGQRQRISVDCPAYADMAK